MGNRKLFDEKSALELLEEFRVSGSNEPFEEIVRRYAAMVFGVCLRVTGDKHDAEDATQAVFLSLALQARTSRQITYVGPWLQKVAHRLALDTKKSRSRRRRREEKLADQHRHASNNGRKTFDGGVFGGGNGHLVNPADKPGTEELKTIMMEELNQLPAKYRVPLVMHYFGGLSRDEISDQLGCNPSTLGVRVHRGKAMLGTRLAKRGIAISAVVMGVMLQHLVSEGAIGPIIGSATAAGGNGLVAGNGIGAMIASAKVVQIIRTTARAVVYAKLRYVVIFALVFGSAAIATGSNVVQQIKSHLPTVNLTGWIKPLLRSILPALQADAATNLDQPNELDRAAIDAQSEPAPKINADPFGEVAPIAAPAWASIATPSVATPSTPAKPSAPVVRQTAVAESLNSIASGILNPPLASNGARKPPQTASADLAIGLSDPPAAAEANPADSVKALDVGASSFTLGAGGGGGSATPQVYVMPANASLHYQSMTIGSRGNAVFVQSSGVNQIADTLTLGAQKDSSGTYQLEGGTLAAARELIGDVGNGSFLQTNGVNVANDSIIVGNSGDGTYTQSGGSVAVNLAAFESTSTSQSKSGLLIAVKNGSSGEYLLTNGSLSADPQQIGVGGIGSIVQSGGTNSTGSIQIATLPGSYGSYVLSGGQLTFYPRGNPNAPDAAISIGGRGHGVFNIGNSNSTGTIYEVGGDAASVIVRGTQSANGSIVGYGTINLGGVMVNNGQVIADGYGTDRTLDLSAFSGIATTIENPRWGGASGWFARRHGELKLPPIAVQAGTNTYTWGEDPGDPMIDLVNSVRFTIENAQHPGDVSISLLSTLRSDIPTLPAGHHFIGVWSFDGSELGGFSGVDLQVRYDDGLAASMGLDENILKLWRYDPDDSQWHRIMDDTFSRDTLDHLISGYAPGEISYFAVSAPEPAAGAILLLAGGLALRRRRRSHRADPGSPVSH